MSWKKNVFSYLLWILYAVAAEVGLVCLAEGICVSLGTGIRAGAAVCVLYMAAAGAGVILIHRFAPKYSAADGKRHTVRSATEAAVAVILLAAGFVLRMGEINGTGAESVYYQMAVIGGEGPSLAVSPDSPQALGLYVRMLRGLFFFAGNKPAAAMWVQLLLQMGAIMLVYLAARRLAGNIAAIVALAFQAVSSYLIGQVSSLSPAMLYFFFWAAVLLAVAVVAGAGKGLWEFLPLGLVIGFLCFLDVAGCLLALIAGTVILSGEEADTERKLKRLLLCLAGTGTGFTGCGLTVSLLRGDGFPGVLRRWILLYRPEGFRLPFSADAVGKTGEYVVLFCVLTLGMFSFWRNRRRDSMKAWILSAAVLAFAGCFGVFTEEMPMGLYMYLLLTLMAGIAAEECVRKIEPAAGMAAAGERTAQTAEASSGFGEGKPPEDRKLSARSAEKTASGGDTAADSVRETDGQQPEDQAEKPAARPVKYIENPLPLPKKHVKKKLEYGMEVPAGKDDFDIQVDEKDDFDI